MQWSWNEPGTVTLNWCFFTHGTRNCEAILQFSHVPRVVSHWAPQVQRPEKTKHPTLRHLAEITGRMVASWAHKANFRAIRFLKTSLYFVHHLGNDNLQLHLVGDVLKKKHKHTQGYFLLVPIVGGRYNPNPNLWFFPGDQVIISSTHQPPKNRFVWGSGPSSPSLLAWHVPVPRPPFGP